MKIAEFLLTLPFKITFAILSFIVWEIISGGSWKQRKRVGTCPVGYWQDQAQWATHQNRQLEYEHCQQEKDLRAAYERELEKKEREISYLRSKLNK